MAIKDNLVDIENKLVNYNAKLLPVVKNRKVEEVKVSAEETERLNQIVYKMMAKNCDHPDDYFLELVHERGHADWFLDGKEAKKHGLASHLRLPTLEIDIDVKIKMR